MFRALLWKEWRELWVLPVAATPLATIGFFSTQKMGRHLDLDIWMWAFSLSLLLAVIYVPSHLYARGKESGAAQFLMSKPLDRFRLWWYKLAIGVTVLAAIAVVSFAVTFALAWFFPRSEAYAARWAAEIWSSICILLFLFGLSMFTSALFKKQAMAIAGSLASCFALLMLLTVLTLTYEPLKALEKFFEDSPGYSETLFLLFCPILLFASLVIFAGRGFRKQTRGRLVIGYAVSAAVTILPSAVGMSFLYSQALAYSGRPPVAEISGIEDISIDGSRMLLNIRRPKATGGKENWLVSLDTQRRQAHIVHKGVSYDPSIHKDGDSIVYAGYDSNALFSFLSSKLILSDFEGSDKKTILGDRFSFSQSEARWSRDGRYLGITRGATGLLAKPGLIAISDVHGALLGEHEFPILEENNYIYPIGWDSESWFYFRRSITKRDENQYTHWRVRPGNLEPEMVPFLPQDEYSFAYLSPDGRRFTWAEYGEPSEKSELWLCEISDGSSKLLSERLLSYRWSQDGTMLAYIEDMREQVDPENEEEPIPRLVIYEIATGKTTATMLDAASGFEGRYPWSLSNEYLFLAGEAKDKRYVFSVQTKKVTKIPALTKHSRAVRWTADDKLIWAVHNRLITTNYDGSNTQEIFRIEGDKFYFDGEEAG